MLDSEFSDEDHLHSNHIESEEDLPQDEDGGEGGDQFDQRGEDEESKGREEKRTRNSKRKDPPIDTTSLEALKRRIVHLETELEKKDDLVEQLTNALETSQEEKEAKDSELAQVTQTLLPLAESLHKMQEQLDERDAHQERERESVEAQFADLVQQLEAAREAIQKKEREIEVLQHENQHLKEQIVIKKGSTSPPSTSEEENGDENDGNVDRQSDVDISSDNRLRQARMEGVDEEVTETEEEYEETMGEAAGPPVRHQGKAEESVVEEEKKSDPIDNFKEEMEREYKKINESLQSAEQFSLMFSKRTRELTSNIYRIREVRELEKEKGKIEESLANDDESSADDGFEQKIKSWPREMVEKQLKHYRDAFNSERKSLEEMEEEKSKVEEELMSAKLELEQKQLEVATLQSGKEQLEQYVAQLAEEMENETSQMVSMKEQFQVETLKFADPDFSAYLESDSEGDTTEGDDDAYRNGQGSSALASPAMSPISTPRGRGEEGPNARMRDITKRRSLNMDLTSSGAVIAAKAKERSKAAHVRSEDEDTATEGMYSEDESREGTEGEEIIGKYREEVSQLREELRTVREELQRAREERERKGTEMRAQLEEKDGKIQLLEDELRRRNSEYENSVRRNSELEEDGQTSMQEIDVLKKELFFSLAVAIKLNLSLQGRKCNVGIASLYESAAVLNKHHSEWSEWILQQLMEAEEPPEPRRGLRSLLFSSTSSRTTHRRSDTSTAL